MNILFGFAPFLAFAVLCHVVSAEAGLLAGAGVSAALLVRDLSRKRAPRVLELGAMLLFLALSIYTFVTAHEWTLMTVRLVVDTGLLLIILGSLLAGKPFTLQYAREGVPGEHWNTEAFVRTNKRITIAWAVAFALIVAADLLLLCQPQAASHMAIALTIGALAWAAHRTRQLSSPTAR